jgi:hypothetical protein
MTETQCVAIMAAILWCDGTRKGEAIDLAGELLERVKEKYPEIDILALGTTPPGCQHEWESWSDNFRTYTTCRHCKISSGQPR